MEPTTQSLDESEEDSSPRHKHLRKLAAEAEVHKKAKAEAMQMAKVEYEAIYDTRGKPKYRKVTTLPNGTKYREFIHPSVAEKMDLKRLKSKTR